MCGVSIPFQETLETVAAASASAARDVERDRTVASSSVSATAAAPASDAPKKKVTSFRDFAAL